MANKKQQMDQQGVDETKRGLLAMDDLPRACQTLARARILEIERRLSVPRLVAASLLQQAQSQPTDQDALEVARKSM